jgi:hypothetical protein
LVASNPTGAVTAGVVVAMIVGSGAAAIQRSVM